MLANTSKNYHYPYTVPYQADGSLALDAARGSVKAPVQEVFQRIEKKYMLDDDQYKALKKALDGYMILDQYGLSTINSIYFDTDSCLLVRRSLEKPVYKEKLRLRGYGRVTESSEVYAEIKKKYKGIVYKRRQPLTVPEAREWLYQGGRAPRDTQIARELEYMEDRYRPRPIVYIGYDREAYFGAEDSQLRLTIDSEMRFRTSELDLTKGSWGHPLIDRSQHLLEIKIPGAIPLWMVRIIEDLSIRPASFSKYGTCYEKFLSKSSQKIIPYQEAAIC